MMRLWILPLLLPCIGFSLLHFKQAKESEHKLLRSIENESPLAIQSRKRRRILQEGVESGERRVVLLAGPHKTASSSIQGNMYKWTTTTEESSRTILPNWTWPVPSKVLEEKYKLNPNKGFYPLILALAKGKGHRTIFDDYTKEEVVDMYRKEFDRAWNNKDKKSLVIGTEAMDQMTLTQDNEKKSDDLRGSLIQTLPNGVKKDSITAVVVYRAPRISHYISLWHQCCAQSGMTFREYLTSSKKAESQLHSVDSIALAKAFLRGGLKTVLIDFSGVVIDAGYDISDVIACDVLKAPCTEGEELVVKGVSEEELGPLVTNVKTNIGDMGGVTETQLKEIDGLLRKFDCTHREVMKHKNLEVLYGTELDRVFSECPSQKEFIARGYPTTLTDLKQKIMLIIDQEVDDSEMELD